MWEVYKNVIRNIFYRIRKSAISTMVSLAVCVLFLFLAHLEMSLAALQVATLAGTGGSTANTGDNNVGPAAAIPGPLGVWVRTTYCS